MICRCHTPAVWGLAVAWLLVGWIAGAGPLSILAADEPAAEPAVEDPVPNPLGGWLQKIWQRAFAPQPLGPPRVRAAEGAVADRAQDAKDPVDARAPRDPKLEGLWTAANSAIQQHDWKRGVERLQRLLDSPEDAVFRAKGGRWDSLRTAASRQLGAAPADVLADYERQYGPLSEQLADRARRTGRIEDLVEVATRFFHTPAGRKAAHRLAAWHLDRAEFALALRWFLELDASPSPETKDPLWRIKAAYAARQASPELVHRFLNPVLANDSARALVLGGERLSAGEWWKQTPSQGPPATPVLRDWLQLFGTAARVGVASGQPPLLKPEWTTPLTTNSAIQRQLDWLLQDLEDEGQSPLMAGVPLAIGNKIVFRDLRGVRVVSAVDGRTIWSTPEGLSPERVLSGAPSPGGSEWQRPVRSRLFDEYDGEDADAHPLVSLLFRDATMGLISSDGTHLFVLEDVAAITRNQAGLPFDRADEPVDPFGAVWSTNRLTAYELGSGRAAWSVGGGVDSRGAVGTLTGCFFLGAPVVDGEELFIVGSQGDEVRLWALDPSTGLLRWSQLLAYADTKIDLDIARRWVGAPIAVGQGVVVCPTTVGWLVAVDRVRRTVLWAHRYLPEEANDDGGVEFSGAQFLSQRELGNQWSASPPVIAGANVIFTPVDGDHIVCLDLPYGRLRWQESREDGRYLAGVVNQRVLIVGDTGVMVRQLDDGKTDWTQEWDEGLRPTGRGVVVGQELYVPLSDHTLRTVAIETGKETGRFALWSGHPALGNLVKAGRQLIAWGPHGCQAFAELPGVLAEIRERKLVNPRDPEALVREAELWLIEARYRDAAIQLRSLGSDPLSSEWAARRRTAFWQALVGLIQTVPSETPAALDELIQLAATPDEKLSVELFRIDRAVADGHLAEAFHAYWALAEKDDAPEFVTRPHQPNLRVRRRTWLQGRMADLWEASEGAVRDRLDADVRAAVDAAVTNSLDDCRRLAEWSDFHPAAARLHWALADAHRLAREHAQAELHLLPWAEHRDASVAAETLLRLSALDRRFGLDDDALQRERQLKTRFGDVRLNSGATLAEALADRPVSAAVFFPKAANRRWDDVTLDPQQVGIQHAPPVQELVSPVSSPYLSRLQIQIESNEQRLTVADRRDGRWRWLAPLRGSARGPDYGHIPTAFLGRGVIVLHRDVLQMLSLVDQRVLWTKALEPGGNGDASSAHRTLPLALQTPSLDEPDHDQLFEQVAAAGRLASVQPGCVCLQGRRAIVVYDPLTGRERWSRAGISAVATLVGTRDYLCVMEHDLDRVTVYRTLDGQPVDAPNVATRVRRAISIDGNDFVLLEALPGLRLFNLTANRCMLRKVNLVTGEERWRQDFAAKTQIGLMNAEWAIAVDAPSGGRTAPRSVALVRLSDGERHTLAPVAFESTEGGLFAIADDERAYLVANKGDGSQYQYGDNLATIAVDGAVCAWDRTTGELLWQRKVADQNLVLDRFSAAPMLLFLTRTWKQKGNASLTILNLLAVGKQTGTTLHESSTPSMFGGFHSMAVHDAEDLVELSSYNLRLRFVPQRPAPSGAN